MRVAAVALVLIVGAAIVLAFANTLNSWVLGGLLGGLAALLLSIPISLALFTLLARHHDAYQRAQDQSFEEEPEFTEDGYDEYMVYEADLSFNDDELPVDPRARALLSEHRLPVSDYLRLPAAGQSQASYAYEEDVELPLRREPRNYPRQPRSTSRSLARDDDEQVSRPSQRSSRSEARRQPFLPTHNLAQHQSEALRAARQEAQQQNSRSRADSHALARRTQEIRAQAQQRARAARQHRSQTSSFGAQRSLDERDTWVSEQEDTQFSWSAEEAYSDEFSTDPLTDQYQHYPRRSSYPRRPRAGRAPSGENWQDTRELDEEEPSVRRSRRDPERLSGSLHNPLVRRAPYLYDDDPLREELAQQLENERQIPRRSSRYLRREHDNEW